MEARLNAVAAESKENMRQHQLATQVLLFFRGQWPPTHPLTRSLTHSHSSTHLLPPLRTAVKRDFERQSKSPQRSRDIRAAMQRPLARKPGYKPFRRSFSLSGASLRAKPVHPYMNEHVKECVAADPSLEHVDGEEEYDDLGDISSPVPTKVARRGDTGAEAAAAPQSPARGIAEITNTASRSEAGGMKKARPPTPRKHLWKERARLPDDQENTENTCPAAHAHLE
jgi:hypothetical protein